MPDLVDRYGKKILLHRVLREVLRNYGVFESLCSQTGDYEISHRGVSFNFLDLQGCLKKLSKRQMEAVFFFVICDEKQKTVAERLGISTVTVGQYCESGLIRVAAELWPEMYEKEKQ